MKIRMMISTVATGFVFITGLAQIADGQNRTVLAEAERISGDRFAVSVRTPMGANVNAVKKPSTAVLKAIDQGLTDLFAVARKYQYRSRLKYSDYTIYIGKADRTKDYVGDYSPDIAVASAQYTGTVYDKGGYIYAAGIVVAFNPCAFLIAEHTKNLERVSNVVRYEGEHLVLYHNDRRRFNETANHSKGGSHPILQ